MFPAPSFPGRRAGSQRSSNWKQKREHGSETAPAAPRLARLVLAAARPAEACACSGAFLGSGRWRRLAVQHDRSWSAGARELALDLDDRDDAARATPLGRPASLGLAAVSCEGRSQRARTVEEAHPLAAGDPR